MGLAANLSSNNCNMGLRFRDIAHIHAKEPALLLAGATVTYAVLEDLSNRAAACLLARGVNTGEVVAIQAEKSLMTYALMLAALKIGAPYTVLDTQSPKERSEKILDCCKPRLLLDEAGLAELKKEADDAKARPLPEVDGATPAYIMFTSGSTGFPKGVTISHASMVNFCDWSQKTFNIKSGDVLTGVNALYFDNSVFDFTASLFNGAALKPVTRDTLSNPKELVQAVADCTIWFSVPSLLIYVRLLRALERTSWPKMRAIIFGGEGFPKAELKKLYDLYSKQTTLWNVYGPTECTCICSAYAICEKDFADMEKLAPLGYLAENFTGAVMDESGTQKVKEGETGELFLMGPQVALGYYNDKERTKTAFAANPLFPGQPCYRTGDLVWQDVQSGYYHFAGRKDNQIKHMGYRIELEEIEAALCSVEGIAQVGVFYQKKEHGGRIIACVQADVREDEIGIKTALRRKLPSYMIPERIQVRSELPKNANGKVDRKALAEQYRDK